MSCRVVSILVVALSVVVSADTASGPVPSRAGAGSQVIHVDDATLREGLARLWRGSPSWRDALTRLVPTGRRIFVLTPGQVVVKDRDEDARGQAFDARLLAETSPVIAAQGAVTAVLVVINLPLVEALHDRRGSLPGEVAADLDRLIAHEVYGHAVPLLEAGHLSGRCADPEPGQLATEACSVRRENIVRRELNLGHRTDAGHDGLLLAFRGRR